MFFRCKYRKFQYLEPTPIEIFLCAITLAPPTEGRQRSLVIKEAGIVKICYSPLLTITTIPLLVKKCRPENRTACTKVHDLLFYSVTTLTIPAPLYE